MICQLSMFEKPLSWIEQCLLTGSLISGGKYRIYGAAIHLDNKDFADFLKEEYGIGGYSVEGGFVMFNSKRLSLRNSKNSYEELYTWSDIATIIKKLVASDKYLTEKEKEYMQKLKERN